MTAIPDHLNQHLGDRYRIERELGHGGMAVVYLAADLRHGRQVAIKVMRPEIADAVGPERFLREIRIAAGLTHPRIVSVFDSGDAGGVLYYIMPFIDAPTLRQRLEKSRPVPFLEATRIARDVARALAHAHHQGIVHRDVKPENIMLPGGEAVVTDFGIARAVGGAEASNLTQAGLALGTPLYMSPEQAFGESDARADVYSLGCVLFEMIAGRPPFQGNTAFAILTRHSTEAAPSIGALRRDVPPWLRRVVARCLAKTPADRPSAAEVEAALDPTTVEMRAVRMPEREPSVRTIAVLPFADLTPERDHSWLCDGIAEELLIALAAVPGLRVVSRTSAFALRDPALDVREKAHRLGATTVLEGSVRVAGERLRVSVQLTSAAEGVQVWSRRFDGSIGDVFHIEDQISRAVVSELRLADGPAATIVEGPTTSVEAHRAYLRGRQALNRRTPIALRESIALFTRAAELDADFAMAHLGLAEADLLLGVYGEAPPDEVMPRSRAAAETSLALRPGLGEALAARATVRAVYDWDWTEAERDFLAALQRQAVPASGRQWYAMYLLAPQGRQGEAREHLSQAARQDPLSPAIAASLGQLAYFAADYELALRHQDAALELAADFFPAHLFRGQTLAEMGRVDEAIESLELASRLTPGSPEVVALLAHARARRGERESAEALIAELRQRSAYVSPVLLAPPFVALGRHDDALDALEHARDLRAVDLVWAGVRPSLSRLRTEPRFQALLATIGLTAAG